MQSNDDIHLVIDHKWQKGCSSQKNGTRRWQRVKSSRFRRLISAPHFLLLFISSRCNISVSTWSLSFCSTLCSSCFSEQKVGDRKSCPYVAPPQDDKEDVGLNIELNCIFYHYNNLGAPQTYVTKGCVWYHHLSGCVPLCKLNSVTCIWKLSHFLQISWQTFTSHHKINVTTKTFLCAQTYFSVCI